MNWEALGAIGELVGAIAVVATLGYLIVQIRQNTRELQHSSSWAINQGLTQIHDRVINNPDLIDILDKGLQDPADLSPKEYELCRAHFMGIFNLAVYFHGVRKTQKVEPAHIDPIKLAGGMYISYPGFKQVIDASANQLPDPSLIEIFRNSEPMSFAQDALSDQSDKTDG